MVDAAGTEPALRNLKATSVAKDHVLCRNAHILKCDFEMAMRRVIVAEYR